MTRPGQYYNHSNSNLETKIVHPCRQLQRLAISGPLLLVMQVGDRPLTLSPCKHRCHPFQVEPQENEHSESE